MVKNKPTVLIAPQKLKKESRHGIQSKVTEENISIALLMRKPPEQQPEDHQRRE